MTYNPVDDKLYLFSSDADNNLRVDKAMSSQLQNLQTDNQIYDVNGNTDHFKLEEDKTNKYFIYQNPSSTFLIEKVQKSLLYEPVDAEIVEDDSSPSY